MLQKHKIINNLPGCRCTQDGCKQIQASKLFYGDTSSDHTSSTDRRTGSSPQERAVETPLWWPPPQKQLALCVHATSEEAQCTTRNSIKDSQTEQNPACLLLVSLSHQNSKLPGHSFLFGTPPELSAPQLKNRQPLFACAPSNISPLKIMFLAVAIIHLVSHPGPLAGGSCTPWAG